MSKARDSFFERLSAYESAVDNSVIISTDPTNTVHNAEAQLFRNGLAITSFALLEDFIKARIGEVLERVGTGLSSFSDLPDPLQIAATAGVVKALTHQERILRGSSEYFTYHQKHSALVASTDGANFSISPLALGFDQSNLNSEAVAKMLSSFNVTEPWNTVQRVAQNVGAGIPAVKGAFDNAMYRRHHAAHRADASIEQPDLRNFTTEVLAIASGIDLTLSLALRRILDRNLDFLNGRPKLSASQVKIRFLKPDGKRLWREVALGKSKAAARSHTLEDLKTKCFKRARQNEEAVIVQDSRGLPERWYTPYIE